MDAPSVSPLRRVVVALALLVPLVVDPHGADTLVFKQLALGVAGLSILLLDALGTLVAGRPFLRATAVEKALLLLALWAGVSLLWAPNPATGLPWLAALLGMVGVSRGLRSVLHGPGDLTRWLAALVAVGVAVVVVDGLAMIETGRDLSAAARKHASWLFKHGNIASNYAVVLLPLAVVLVFSAATLRGRVLGGAAVLSLLGYLVLLRSRAGLLAAILGCGVTALILLARRRFGDLPVPGRRAAFVAGLFVVLGALAPLSEATRGILKSCFYAVVRLLQAFGSGELDQTAFRMVLFRKAVEMSAERPLQGVGAGNFPVVYPRFEPLTQVKPHAHNDVLHTLAELGLPGVVLLLAVFALLAFALLRALGRARDAAGFRLSAGLLGSFAAFLICGLFEVPFRMAATASILAFLAGASLVFDSSTGTRTLPSGAPARVLAGTTLLVALLGLAFVGWRLPASMRLSEALIALEEAARMDAAGESEAARARRREGRSSLEALVALPTGSPLPWALLGRLALAEGEREAARAALAAARARAPYDVEFLQDEGEVLIELGRHDEALQRFRQAVARSPARKDALVRLVHALAAGGRRKDAIDLLEHEAQARPTDVDMEIVLMLAHQWRFLAESEEGPERTRALVAARHFYAVVLEDAEARLALLVVRHFQHCTHQLQILPGAPDSWWEEIYEPWLAAGNWRLPNAALWTAMDGSGRKLYPGWEEAAGPPLPRHLR